MQKYPNFLKCLSNLLYMQIGGVGGVIYRVGSCTHLGPWAEMGRVQVVVYEYQVTSERPSVKGGKKKKAKAHHVVYSSLSKEIVHVFIFYIQSAKPRATPLSRHILSGARVVRSSVRRRRPLSGVIMSATLGGGMGILDCRSVTFG